MKVLVGGKLHDAEREPIVVVLTVQDRENIARMLPTATKYLVCQRGSLSGEQIADLMRRAGEPGEGQT